MTLKPAIPAWMFKDDTDTQAAEPTYDDNGILTVSFKLFAHIPVTYHIHLHRHRVNCLRSHKRNRAREDLNLNPFYKLDSVQTPRCLERKKENF